MDYEIINRLKKVEERSMACEVCKERQIEITRILKSYNKEKRILHIALASQMAIIIVLASLGKEGIKTILDAAIKKFF